LVGVIPQTKHFIEEWIHDNHLILYEVIPKTKHLPKLKFGGMTLFLILVLPK
jgi:hypothetical protein